MKDLKEFVVDKIRSAKKRSWLIVSLAACAMVVAYATWPVLQHSQLEPDDYRYLEEVQHLRKDFLGNISKVSVVENKWDQLWWIDIHGKVCFFRPTVVLSYWLDSTIYGRDNALGLLITNALIYLTCVFLVCVISYRWIGPGIPHLVASVLFASFFAHGEVMWYVAGRTDSLAALFLLAGLSLHVYGKEHFALRWWAVPCFVLAFLTKELTATIPLILLLNDYWIEKRFTDFKTFLKHEGNLYALYGSIVVCLWSLRTWILWGTDTGYPYPYFVTLGNPSFLSHLMDQVNSYCANLLFAVSTIPFNSSTDSASLVSLRGTLAGIAAFGVTSFLLRREKKYWLLVLIGLAFWFPTIMLYQTERYLFLPSFAVAGAVGLLLTRLGQKNHMLYYAALLTCIVWIGDQAFSLHVKNRAISSTPRLPESMGRQLTSLRSSIPKGSSLLLLNLPGGVIQDQFIEDQFRVQLDDPNLDVSVITPMPDFADMGASLTVTREGENTIVVQDGEFTPVMRRGQDRFPWVRLDSSLKYETTSGIKVEVLSGDEDACDAIRCVLPHPVSKYILLKWDPASEIVTSSTTAIVVRSPYNRMLQSTMKILTP
jgi:hypothetical protein